MNIYFKIGILLMGIFVIMALVSILLIISDRVKLNELSQEKDYLGGFHGGIFFSQPLLPLDESTDKNLNKIIIEHNKKIKFLYLSFVFLIAAIVLFNIGN